MNSECKKRKDKVQYAMHRIFGRYHQNGEKDGQKRYEVKCIHGYLLQNLCPSKQSGAKV